MLRESFRDVYKKLFDRFEEDVPIEVLNWRLIAMGPRPSVGFAQDYGEVSQSNSVSERPKQDGRRGESER